MVKTPQERYPRIYFNQFLRKHPEIPKDDHEHVFELYTQHGDNAVEIYKQEQAQKAEENAKKSNTSSSPKTLNIFETETSTPESQHSNKPQEPTEKDTPPQSSNEWIEQYETSFNKWVKNNTFKQDNTPKRTISTTKTEDSLDIDILPVNPSPHRADKGASYHFENGETEEELNITVTNKNPDKPLNYDYVYALVKSAKENGIETINFADIKTAEFANMLMVASLQFDMKMENQPEYMIDENVKYIPSKLKEKIAQYNEDKLPLPGQNQPSENKKGKSTSKNKPKIQRPQKEME